MTERGISDALGYVFVFAIITITIGLVYGSGITGLADVQQHEQINNVELAFDVLDNNIESISKRGARSRATELKLAGGSISVGDSVRLQVKTNSTEPVICNEDSPVTISARPIVYQKGGSEVIYSVGAIFRADGTEAAMVADPDWIIGSDHSIVSIITTTTSGSTSIGGDLSILIVANDRGQNLRCEFEDPPSPLRVNVTVESPRAPAWEQHFEDQGFDISSSSDDRVVAKFNTSEFYLTDTTVGIEFVT